MSTLALQGGAPELTFPDQFPAWPPVGPGDHEALCKVLDSGHWGSTSGSVVSQFQTDFAAYQDARHGLALANGTLALVAALRACGVGLGDEVIVPPYTFVATASSALFVGAMPVFADIDPETHLLDPAAVEAALTPRTRAVIPVHLGGRAADMDAFRRIGDEHGLAVIEDCAQAIGARYKGMAVGGLGDVGTFSFQSSKNMTAGEGGLVTTNDQEMAGALYTTINVGRVPGGGWYQHQNVGYNLRMTEFQGALLGQQLKRHPEEQEVREGNARILESELRGVDGVVLPRVDDSVTAHGRHLFLLRVPDLARAGLRDLAVEALDAEGVTAATGYVPLHQNDAVQDEARRIAEKLGHDRPETACPQAEVVAEDTIWLPQRMLLGTQEQTYAIARAIRKVVSSADDLHAAG